MPPWKTRSSQTGYYVACEHRAYLDRVFATSDSLVQIVEEESRGQPYADFGTCVHWTMQEKLGCLFPATDEYTGDADVAACHAPLYIYTDEHLLGAKKIKKGLDEVNNVAELGVLHMYDSPDTQPWMAETAWTNDYMTGHIDFLSQDLSCIVDLKTTTRAPAGGVIKPEHYYQLLAYSLLVGDTVTKAYILYVHTHGDWVIQSKPIDFTSKSVSTDRYNLARYLTRLVDGPHTPPFPRMGQACKSTYCKYQDYCASGRLAGARTQIKSEEADEFAGVVPLWLKK